MIDSNTKLSSSKYKTIGNLLKESITTIVRVAGNEKNKLVRDYLCEWIYVTHYSKIIMEGNLTSRVKIIANKPCYYYIIKTVFNDIDFLQHKKTKQVLDNNCLAFIKKLHTIDPSLAGTYLDYLVRRIVCETTNKPFSDNRNEYYGCNDDNEFAKLIPDSYKKAMNTSLYKTETVLLDIFITSIVHSLVFSRMLDKDKVYNIMDLLKNTSDIIETFYTPLKQFCAEHLHETNDILLNPALGSDMPLLNNKYIPSDCDMVANDILYDFKCTGTARDNSIYEILQLLGYASLLNCVPSFNKKINTIAIINFLQGYIVSYDISHITLEQKVDYLKFLTKD